MATATTTRLPSDTPLTAEEENEENEAEDLLDDQDDAESLGSGLILGSPARTQQSQPPNDVPPLVQYKQLQLINIAKRKFYSKTIRKMYFKYPNLLIDSKDPMADKLKHMSIDDLEMTIENLDMQIKMRLDSKMGVRAAWMLGSVMELVLDIPGISDDMQRDAGLVDLLQGVGGGYLSMLPDLVKMGVLITSHIHEHLIKDRSTEHQTHAQTTANTRPQATDLDDSSSMNPHQNNNS